VSLRRRWRSCEEFVDLGGDLVEGVEVGDLRLQTLGRAGVGGVAQHSTDRVTDRLVGGVAGAQVDPGPGPRDMGGDLGFVLGVPGHHQWQSVRQRLQDPAVTAVGHQDVGVRQQQVERHEPTDPGVGRHAPERGVLAAGGSPPPGRRCRPAVAAPARTGRRCPGWPPCPGRPPPPARARSTSGHHAGSATSRVGGAAGMGPTNRSPGGASERGYSNPAGDNWRRRSGTLARPSKNRGIGSVTPNRPTTSRRRVPARAGSHRPSAPPGR